MTDFKDIRAFVFDVDGVFTDGSLFCDLNGELFRTFNAKDGFSLRMAFMHGYNIGIITGGRSKSITARFLTSGLYEDDIYLGARNKTEQLEDFCKRHSLTLSQVLFIGDDIPDIGVIKAAGIGMCPSDAVEQVKAAADIVSDYPGGKGCVRHAVEAVMTAQGKWEFDPLQYKRLF